MRKYARYLTYTFFAALVMPIPSQIVAQGNDLIGLEIAPLLDVQFGGPFGEGENILFWASELGTLMAGIDSTRNNKCSTSWSLNNSGRHSTIFGSNNILRGDNSAIWGNCNKIYANNTTVTGEGNVANASLSTIIGQENRSEGSRSFIAGYGNISRSLDEFIIGRYNDTIATPEIVILGDPDYKPLFIIGNGSNNDHRSNALSVYNNGRTIIGNGSPETDLHIKQSSLDPNGGTGGIRFETLFNHWQIYTTGADFNFAHNDHKVAHINQNGEFITPANFLDFKKNKNELKNMSKQLLKIELISRSNASNVEEIELNPIQVNEKLPRIIAYDNITREPYGIKYRQLYLTAIAALQEEIKTNETQSLEIESLKVQITQIQEQIKKK